MVTSVLEHVWPTDLARPDVNTTPLSYEAREGAVERIAPHRIDRERYEQWLLLPTDELERVARREIERELSLSEDGLREAAYRRLTTWLDMDREDARILARVWDEAATVLPVDQARRRMEAEGDAALRGLTFREFTRLAGLVPWMNSHFGLATLGRVAREQMPQAA
jgi:hypothetical protein